jgi:hypothetical protein
MDEWEKELSCALSCGTCQKEMASREQRILSVYTHQPICMDCKREEEKRSDYADASKGMIARCIRETGRISGSPESYCFHHFCPFKC